MMYFLRSKGKKDNGNMEIVQKSEVGAWRWIKIVLQQESICIFNKAGVYISHTDLTDLTELEN